MWLLYLFSLNLWTSILFHRQLLKFLFTYAPIITDRIFSLSSGVKILSLFDIIDVVWKDIVKINRKLSDMVQFRKWTHFFLVIYHLYGKKRLSICYSYLVRNHFSLLCLSCIYASIYNWIHLNINYYRFIFHFFPLHIHIYRIIYLDALSQSRVPFTMKDPEKLPQ